MRLREHQVVFALVFLLGWSYFSALAITPSSNKKCQTTHSKDKDKDCIGYNKGKDKDKDRNITTMAPVADAGENRTAIVGKPIILDGRKSTSPGANKITFLWGILSSPEGSAATLTDSRSVRPSLTPDKVGNYQIQLTVNDGRMNSSAATVTITASSPNVAPNADAGFDRTAVAGQA